MLGTAGLAAADGLSERDLGLYRAAFKAAEAARWPEANAIASQAGEKLPAKAIQWLDMARSDTDAGFEAIADFIRRNPEWPNLNTLRRSAEMAMPLWMPDGDVKAWFGKYPPLTGGGVLRYATVLLNDGKTREATELVRERWVSGGFGATEEMDLRARFGDLLRPRDHIARLDRLVWDNEEAAARRMFSLIDGGHQALAEARLFLANMKKGNVDTVLNKVPPSLQSDPGLLYERARWRRRKDMDDGALDILMNRPADMVRPAAWWSEMHILARRSIEKGNYAEAYRIARNSGQKDGLALSQAEFLAGWLALRFLNKPQEALKHFEQLYAAVSAPISRSRGAYWAGRAAEDLKQPDQARRWYDLAGEHVTTFYGQLARKRVRNTNDAAVPGDARIGQDAVAAFNAAELPRLARMLNLIDPVADREGIFVRRLGSNAKTAQDYALVTRLAQDLVRPDLAVTVAKQAVQDGVTLINAGYPVVSMPDLGWLEPALVHSLIRQESTFNENAVSPAGARGLMQLMPATAKQVAGQLGMQHTNSRLTSDPTYNIALGSAYMRELIDRFNGSYVLAIAAYNAGPGRVREWLQTNGDPRAEGVDVVDWIELIPIYETRNYVQRVMEAVHIYRARMDGGHAKLLLEEDLRR
ncbi:lytic transglycosylase [Skermanella aerolata]|uniref:Lytic transglycosylase n=1 Tax=Skermanella aerolata TaxID=393310 RepID=A0A512DJR0_9PROT|nr:lytic transglycosylase domain-containing protein [Skermanella aerolata]KJB97085.1 soluble lytic murein transglycosylase [Skermanella aerolata KACC 11604]GEO36718.1 lytic transglycosylase [Skermanella aerolata]